MDKAELLERLKDLEEKVDEYNKQVDNHTTYTDLKYNLYNEYSDDINFGDISDFPESIRHSLSEIFAEYNYRRRKLEADYGLVFDKSINAPRNKIKKRKVTVNPKVYIRNSLAVLLVAAGLTAAVVKIPEVIDNIKTESMYSKNTKEYIDKFNDRVLLPYKHEIEINGINLGDCYYDYNKIAYELSYFGYQRFDTNLYILSKFMNASEIDRVLAYTDYKSLRNYLFETRCYSQDADINNQIEFEKAFETFKKREKNLFNIFYGEDFEERKTL